MCNVQKIECRNHLLQNYCNKLKEIDSKTQLGYSLTIRKILLASLVRFRGAVTKAIEYRRSQADKVANLRKDVQNSVHHIFGQHDSCDSNFCSGAKHGEVNMIPEIKKTKMYGDIMSVNRRIMNNASSLLHNVDNNVCEQFNSIINKFLGGKRVNFALRGSYATRCEGAVISANTSEFFTSIHKAMLNNNDSGYITKEFEKRKKHATEKHRERRKTARSEIRERKP